MTMLSFWKTRVPTRWRSAPEQARKYDGKPEPSPQAAAEKRRLADTDGTLRRIRQKVEDNRLL